ncbi:MAG TPA: 30S ribosomal protein S12 methylthiotransferase RimO [Tepidisphaeraceae bacterium]|jgi:ribosomal protein S12 methylthiotransferase
MTSTESDTIQSVAFVSLGCAKNLVDSERMLGLLAADGISITPDAESADAIVINTCGFLEASKEESMREINDAIALKSAGVCKRVIVAGCLVQRHKTKLLDDAPGIDRLVGVFDREHIVEAVRGASNPRSAHGHYLGKYHDLSNDLAKARGLAVGAGPQTKTNRLPVFEDDRARLRLTPRHFAYLRMSEGCNQGCAFCTIPGIRGPMRSKPMEQILAEARELASDGAVELNLIGQDTTSYGTDWNQDANAQAGGLSHLLRTLDKQLPRDVQWLRLMYAYPSCFTDEMIDAIAQCERVVKYIDMPLQHVNDRLLGVMKRRVSRKQIETLLHKLRTRIPGMAIRTTFIAGSPGETDTEHFELVRFVKDFGFDHMGVFPFSPEPGTPMGRMDGQIPDDVKQSRVEELMLAQQDVVFNRNANRVGESIDVLIERRDGKSYVGRHAGQAPDIDSVVFVKSKSKHVPGDVVRVKITDFKAYDLVADVPTSQRRKLAVVTA